MALIGKRELVSQISEAVVNRSCRQHEDFCLHAFFDNFIHQFLVTCLTIIIDIIISEIVRLVDHNEVVVPPIHPIERYAQRLPRRS